MTGYRFPFGQPVRTLVQQDRTPKLVFILGVYASAVHARWVGANGKTKITALAVASEPYIFWQGDGAGSIIADIKLPTGSGKLVPAVAHLNGPSGRSLDECFLTPLELTRRDVWLSDIVPHSCLNPKQDQAIQREYMPLMAEYDLPEVSLPPVPNPLCDDDRRREILAELQESQADVLVLLGDEPIRWFLRYYDHRWSCLSDFGTTPETYGVYHPVTIEGRTYQVLPLVHPRQASQLGTHSAQWHALHRAWMTKGGQ